MAPMTRTQTRAYGVVTPSSRQPLLEAMLRAFVWLVSNLALACRAILNRPTRDWHTDEPEEDQLPTPNDITQEPRHPQPPFSGKRKARIPGILVASTQGTTPHSRATKNRDARHKAEHDTVDFAITVLETDLLVRVPRAGVGEERRRRRDLVRGTKSRDASRELCSWPPVSAHRALLAYAGPSPLIPTTVGIQGRPRPLSKVAASSLQHNRIWIPTVVGMSGSCCGYRGRNHSLT